MVGWLVGKQRCRQLPYRGVKGGTLPEPLLVPNVHVIRAGAEFGRSQRGPGVINEQAMGTAYPWSF